MYLIGIEINNDYILLMIYCNLFTSFILQLHSVTPCIWLGTTHPPCNPPNCGLWVNLHFFMMCIYKHCFLPMLLIFAIKCCTKMPCPLPHNHYCCFCLLPSPIACSPSCVMLMFIAFFYFFLFLLYATFLCDFILVCLCTYFFFCFHFCVILRFFFNWLVNMFLIS